MDADNAAMSGTTIDDVVRRLSTADLGTLTFLAIGAMCHDVVSHAIMPGASLLTCGRIDARLKLEAATTLRDSLDHYTSGPIYTPFLKRLMPIFINILRGPCIFQSNSPEQVCLNAEHKH